MKSEERYEIVEDAHGEGGFGKVSKHNDLVLNRFVAIKELHFPDDDKARERFKREAKILASMSHPNIPAIYDVDFSDKGMKIYFEFIEGRSLRSIIQDENIPKIEQVRRWFLQVGSALEHSHTLNIIHRDIKPSNIVVSGDNKNAVLVDFGIAFTGSDLI